MSDNHLLSQVCALATMTTAYMHQLQERGRGVTFQHHLAGFLLAYRMPHAMTNVAPYELLMNRKIRTGLDLLYPDVESRVAKNVSRQKAMHEVHANF